ncbi:hypothetical protein [Microvirga brassicacearum]|uniref:Uncharacterized protein n=1 Tax=Microvirga brassicacearum TaxID=2580413 RepID=A0A5N3P3K6_9HYPH|nr:hypothetical protein [Microvirga brassicacearum]KAB0264302.1 hypothetical protein FEZ63_23665 [Microvirga brassicacearum]
MKGRYQMQDPGTGLFLKFDAGSNQVISAKSTPGPFRNVRIKTALANAQRLAAASGSSVETKKAKRDSSERAASPEARPVVSDAEAGKKVAASRTTANTPRVKRPPGRPSSLRGKKAVSEQPSAREFSQRALAARHART